MDQPIIALMDEIVRAAQHYKRESRFLEDEDLLILFGAHVRMKLEEYQDAMSRQEARGACALPLTMRMGAEMRAEAL